MTLLAQDKGPWSLAVETLPHHPSASPGEFSSSAVPKCWRECCLITYNSFHYLETIILIRREIQESLKLTPGYRFFVRRKKTFFFPQSPSSPCVGEASWDTQPEGWVYICEDTLFLLSCFHKPGSLTLPCQAGKTVVSLSRVMALDCVVAHADLESGSLALGSLWKSGHSCCKFLRQAVLWPGEKWKSDQ